MFSILLGLDVTTPDTDSQILDSSLLPQASTGECLFVILRGWIAEGLRFVSHSAIRELLASPISASPDILVRKE